MNKQRPINNANIKKKQKTLKHFAPRISRYFWNFKMSKIKIILSFGIGCFAFKNGQKLLENFKLWKLFYFGLVFIANCIGYLLYFFMFALLLGSIFQLSLNTYYKLQSFTFWTSVGSFHVLHLCRTTLSGDLSKYNTIYSSTTTHY